MQVGKKGGAIAEINVTPMADVIIVLLIIFMVITPMLQKGVDVKLPVAGNTDDRKDEEGKITVAVKLDLTTYLNGIPLADQQQLLPQIEERIQDIPEGERLIYLKGDEGLEYGEIMKVMDLCREAGVEEIALIAEPEVQG
jgi:biopolymer transport protein ExbD